MIVDSIAGLVTAAVFLWLVGRWHQKIGDTLGAVMCAGVFLVPLGALGMLAYTGSWLWLAVAALAMIPVWIVVDS